MPSALRLFINGLPIVLRNRVRSAETAWDFEQVRPTTGVEALLTPAKFHCSPQQSHLSGTTRASRCGNEFCAISVRTIIGSNLSTVYLPRAEKVSSRMGYSAVFVCSACTWMPSSSAFFRGPNDCGVRTPDLYAAWIVALSKREDLWCFYGLPGKC